MEPSEQKSVMMRLKRIEGQVRGIQRMIEEEANCREILTQIAAVKAAVSQVGILVFEKHAHECIHRALDEENEEENFREIVTMMSKLIK